MLRNYETIVNEYARFSASIEYIRVLKQFGAEIYRKNEIMFDKRLDELNKECDKLLDELGVLVS